MCFQQAVDMVAQIATVLICGFAGWALCYSAKTNKLQKDSIDIQIKSQKASLFNDILGGINEVIKQETAAEDEDKFRWFYLLYNAFELYAYYAVRNYIDLEMAGYLKDFICGYNERVKKCPALIDKFMAGHSPNRFKYLRELCPDLPF